MRVGIGRQEAGRPVQLVRAVSLTFHAMALSLIVELQGLTRRIALERKGSRTGDGDTAAATPQSLPASQEGLGDGPHAGP